MKITSFNPVILSPKSSELVAVFEALGFETHHHNTENAGRESVQMKDANGFRVDLVQNNQLSQDLTVIRVNVDDFDKAHDVLLAKGFKDGPTLRDADSAKSLGMIAPSGFVIGLVEHKK